MTLERNLRPSQNAGGVKREFELPGEEVVVHEEADRLVIEPAAVKSLLAVPATLEPVEEEFSAVEELPPAPVDL